MVHRRHLPLLLTSVLVLSSCAGAGRDALTGYSGTWSGSADVVSGGLVTQPGTITLIFNDGNVTGTDTVTTFGVTSTDTGSISSTGALSLTSTNSTTSSTIAGNLTYLQNQLEGTMVVTLASTNTENVNFYLGKVYPGPPAKTSLSQISR